jgi:hypothetical protein
VTGEKLVSTLPASTADPGNIIRIQLKDPNEIAQSDPEDIIGGHNSRALVLNSTDTRAYVFDFVSRDVAVVDISGNDPTAYKTIARIPSLALPAAGSVDALVQRGKLFNSHRPGRRAAQFTSPSRTHVRHWLGDVLQLSRERFDR